MNLEANLVIFKMTHEMPDYTFKRLKLHTNVKDHYLLFIALLQAYFFPFRNYLIYSLSN